ncbi:tape measure protein [Parabacteroides distasonis]|uniref:tape measure protein n=1 Tax=Parabacteroides distasonis TaxID=823 RepID=UPI003F23CBBA
MDAQGTIGIKATLDISEMQRNVQRYVQNINMMQSHTDTASASVAKSFGRMQAAAGAFLSLDMAKRLASEMVSVYGTFQQLDIAFRTMLHSGEKAKVLMGELVNFAAVTPFNLTEVGQGAKQLLAYGTAADKITSDLEMLGNVASGVSIPIGELVYLYGTLRSQGRAYTVDIRQFAGRGIPIYEELAKILNVSVGEVNTLVEAGRVGFPEVEKAFQNMTNKGGTFFNLMRDQSKAVTGQISNLMDNIETKFNEVGKSNDALITGGISGANYLVDHYKEIGSALAGLIALYGVHKTALIANAAYYGALKKAESVAVIKAESEALKNLETTEIKANLSKQGLIAGTKEYIEALKTEIKTEMDRLTQVAVVANTELDAAKDRLEAADELREQALNNVQLKKQELEAARSSSLADKDAADIAKVASIEKNMALESERQSRAALLAVKLQDQKQTAIASVEEMKYQRWLLSSSGKDTAVIDAKITAKNREIAKISEKIAAARAEEVQHARNVVAYRSEIKTIDTAISTKGIEKAETALNTAEQRLNTAEVNRNTAAREVNAKRALIDSSVRKANTLETGLDTASVAANTAAKSVGAKVTGLLTAATAKLNAVIAANVWTIAIAGILAASYGIYKLITYQTDAEKWQGKLNDRLDEFNSATMQEKVEIDSLFGKLDAAKKGTKEYKDAKDAILAKYGNYLQGLSDEIQKLEDVAGAYDAITESAKKAARERAITDALGDAKDVYSEKSTSLISGLQKSINESKSLTDREKSKLFNIIKREIEQSGKISSETQKYVDLFKQQVLLPSGNFGAASTIEVNKVQDDINKLIKTTEEYKKTIDDVHETFGVQQNNYLELSTKELDALIQRYEKAYQLSKGGNAQVVQLPNGKLTDLQTNLQLELELRDLREARRNAEKQESKELETVAKRKERWTKELTEAEEKLKKLKDDNSTATKKEIDDQQKIVDQLKKNLEIDSKTLNSKEKKQEEANRLKVESAERLHQLNEQLQQEREAAVQAELDIAQAKIDAMNEGHLKQQAQIELNFRKAKVENDRRVNEYIKSQQKIEQLAFEKEHPDYKNKGLVFEPKTKTKADLSKEKQDTIAAYDNAAADARKKAEVTLFKSLTEEYQSYTDQRLAIEKKFNDDLTALQAERSKYQKNGDTDKVAQIDRSIAQATKNKGKSLMGLDFEQLKQTPEYVRAFENLKNTSSETLDSLLAQLENAKQTAASVLNPEDLREYTTTIQSIMDELDSRNPFKALLDRKKELEEVGEELANAKSQLNYVQAGGKIVTGIRSTNFNKDTGAIEVENEYLSVAKALEIYRKAQDKAAKASNKFQSAEEEVADVVDKLFTSIKDVGETIGGTSGEVLSFIGDIGLFVTSSINAWETAANAGSKAVQAVEKASVILAVISTVIQLMQKLSSLTKSAYEQYETYAEKVKEINTLKDAVNDYTIAVLEAKQAEDEWFSDKNLNSLRNYRELNEKVTEAYYGKLFEDQATYQNKKGGGWLTGGLNGIMNTLSPLGWTGVWQKWTGQNYKEGISKAIDNLRIETRKKSNGFLGTGIGAKSQKTEDLATWIKNQPEFKGADLFDDKGLIDKELAKQVVEKYGDKLVGETKDTLEALIDLREKYDEYMEQLHDYVSSLYDPLVGNFVDSLWDWLDSGKDALDSFKEYASDTFRDIVSDMMKTIVLEKVIGNFDDDIADLYDKYASKEISETDLMKMVAERTGELVDNYEKNIPVLENILSSVNGYFKDAGIDLKQQDESSRSAVEKGIESVSQDSVTEMNGRLMAVSIVLNDIVAAINEQTAAQDGIVLSITEMKNSTLMVNENVKIIKDNMIVITGHLRNIEINTDKLNEINKKMGAVCEHLEIIVDKGVNML